MVGKQNYVFELNICFRTVTKDRREPYPERNSLRGRGGRRLRGAVEYERPCGVKTSSATGVPQRSHKMSRLSITSRGSTGLDSGDAASDAGTVPASDSMPLASSTPRGLKTCARFSDRIGRVAHRLAGDLRVPVSGVLDEDAPQLTEEPMPKQVRPAIAQTLLVERHLGRQREPVLVISLTLRERRLMV